MAQFGKDLENFSASRTIKIVDTETVETYTVYVIEVNIGPYTWTVRHRYSAFHDLHEKLTSSCKLDKNLLPPKKLFGNQSESFIKKRQNDLEVYLQTVLYYLAHKLPGCLATFLHFSQYEIHGITQAMAEELYNKGDLLLQSRELFKTSPLQLYALTERLKLPEPTCEPNTVPVTEPGNLPARNYEDAQESGDVKRDIGHILDFITRLKDLQVTGGEPVGASNIDMNQLKFDLTLFKSVQRLQVINCDVSLILGLETVKQTLQNVAVYSSLKAIRDLLLQDIPHWKAEDGTLVVSYWDGLRHVDFSHNSIAQIDDSVQLMPQVEYFDLSYNKISHIQHLQWLSQMTYLDLSHNALHQLEALHSKLGNLKTLKLSGNKLESLQGLSKLFSLETLDVCYNHISVVEEVKWVSGLPCLENLLLQGNPVTIVLDYRTKTLAMFGDRVSEVCLDREKPSQKELDTVAVLQAIQKSKEKAKKITAKKSAREVTITDLDPSSAPSTSAGTSREPPGSHPTGNQDREVTPVAQREVTPASQREATPLVQRYNLFKREEPVSSQCVVMGAGHSSNIHSLESDGEMRERVESLRCQGGSSWLNLLNQSKLYTENAQSERVNSDTGSYCSASAQLSQGVPMQTTINVGNLPVKDNTEFSSWLHARLFGETDSSGSKVEKIKSVMWCPMVQFTNQEVLVPVCAVLTERRVFILQLKTLDSNFNGVPEMETFYILPLCNIQQVIVGPCYSHICFEESFVGPGGTFALVAPDVDTGKAFCDELSSVCEKQQDGGDMLIVNSSQTSDLTRQIFDAEDARGLCTGRIAFAALVRVSETGSLAHLVLSENQTYIVKTCCLFWPKPTFDTSDLETTTKVFEIAQQFSVEGKISEISMYLAKEKVLFEQKEEDDDIEVVSPRFEEFGLSMMFHELLGSHRFDFRFISIKARDDFLARLTNLRAEHAHQMSPTIREEPEGGNDLTDHTDGTGHVKFKESESSESSDDEEEEYLTGDDSRVDANSQAVSSQRKARSKTEGIISLKHSEEGADNLELPSYTWHYLSDELTVHLRQCVQQYTLFQPLSPKLNALTQMDGEELTQFFHKNIVPIGMEGEELHHIVWSNVIPYTNPNDEIVTCVMLSNRAVYLVSDHRLRLPPKAGRPSWMTHARHSSDSVIGLQAKRSDQHHSAGGVLHMLSAENSSAIVRPYAILEFSDIHQVNVGLFDQCVRLTGSNRESVFTVVTRDSEVTSSLMKHFSTMLSLYIASPMLDKSTSDLEQDFYKAFNKRTKTTMEGMEYLHPSKVKFCYPGDEAIADMVFIIDEHLKLLNMRVGHDQILAYILGYTVPETCQAMVPVLLRPVTVILTSDCMCLLTEDLVSYPLPDFVRDLPGTPRQKVVAVRKIEYLKVIVQNKLNPRELTLVFSDEKEDIVLVFDHYSLQKTEEGRDTPPEIHVRLFVQSEREKKKFINLLQNQWRESHEDSHLTVITQ